MSKVREGLKALAREEDGLGTLELILIIAVIIILAIAFRKWIMKWVGDLFKNTNTQVDWFNNDTTNINPSSSPAP